MAFTGDDPRGDQQRNTEGNQRSESSESSSSTSPTPGSYRRTLMLILNLLIILLVLNQHLNHSLAADNQELDEMDKLNEIIIQDEIEGTPAIRGTSRKKQSIPATPGVALKKFDYFVLTMTWPTTICAKILLGIIKEVGITTFKRCKEEKLKYFQKFRNYRFTIHGLWPCQKELAVGSGPVDCALVVGNKLKRDSIRIDIETYWPSFIKEKSEFWNSEWEKHGRCATKHPLVKDSVGYFTWTVRLATGLDTLQRNLIENYPDLRDEKEVVINFQDLRTFLRDQHQGDVVIQYQQVPMKEGGQAQNWVDTLYFCYNLKFQAMECPIKKENTFRGQVVLPTINSLENVQVPLSRRRHRTV